MIDTKILTKRYYTIAEVGEMFDVAKSLLRYWEGEFKEIRPKKDRGGVRRYTAKDIEKINLIFDLVKNRGFTIEGARKELSKGSGRKLSNREIQSRLNNILQRLKVLRSEL